MASRTIMAHRRVKLARLPADALIAEEKVRRYLLAHRAKNDKSGFFAGAGYAGNNWRQLADDIREQLLPLEADLSRQTRYGELYAIRGQLRGPNGSILRTLSVWIVDNSGVTRLVTIYPDKEQQEA